MKNGRGRLKSIIYSTCTGVFTVFLFSLFYFAANKNTAPFLLVLREVFPLYEDGVTSVINLYAFEENVLAEDAFADTPIQHDVETSPETGGEAEAKAANDIYGKDDTKETAPLILGKSDVVYQPGTDLEANDNSQSEYLTKNDLEKLMDFEYLKSKLYTVDKRTSLFESDIDVNGFLSRDLKIDAKTPGAKVLIFHTHSQEGFSDSEAGNLNDGILAVGERLKELLENKYGIETMHDTTSYDIVDGKSQTLGAYERMEPSVSRILRENPSIEVVIDMHRDGVSEDLRFVTDINGKQSAKIMFFNGLTRVYQNGAPTEISGLSNPYVKDNLALSFNLQLLANELYPGLTRKIYVNAYRYSLHFKPKSLLIEVGAQTNTKSEALNAMEPLAEILAKTLK